MYMADEDIFFLESWLSNYVEVDTGCQECPRLARRWARGKHQMLTVRKKAVMEAKTTDLARKMQFQSFDLDGNALITRSDLGFALNQVGMLDKMDEFMAQMDSGGSNNGCTKENFKPWADGGSLDERTLQHMEALGNIAQRF